jgi:hypothetical protein
VRSSDNLNDLPDTAHSVHRLDSLDCRLWPHPRGQCTYDGDPVRKHNTADNNDLDDYGNNFYDDHPSHYDGVDDRSED